TRGEMPSLQCQHVDDRDADCALLTAVLRGNRELSNLAVFDQLRDAVTTDAQVLLLSMAMRESPPVAEVVPADGRV
ncbi:MAG TPA: hypothetical protein VGQ62_24085, partial [Chloroflexota bacterium]|nr:hypothetical protein [Chloroflexota bacterium]